MFTIRCAVCKNPLNLPDEVAGKAIRCLRCKTLILVPRHPEENASYVVGENSTDVAADDQSFEDPASGD
jgi:phage FluMu protein Com